jgi:hypothetical protein
MNCSGQIDILHALSSVYNGDKMQKAIHTSSPCNATRSNAYGCSLPPAFRLSSLIATTQ